MKSVSLASERHLNTTARPGALDSFARRLVLKQLETALVSLSKAEQI